MENITELKRGSLNGLRRQTNECLVSAYYKGYEDGKKQAISEIPEVANKENEMYDRGVEDLSKAIMWYRNLKHNERVKYIGKNLAIHELIENTPQKLIERFKAYEENKQAEDEIKVGDIVRYATDIDKMIVTRVTNEKIETLDKNGCVESWKKTAALHKWGNENVADKLQALFEGSKESLDE